MNTNSKHYEELNIQPWEIMERNFTNEEFVAYLKGNIIKYTLRNKGQALTDAQKIKHYAEKLIEVLESKWEPEFKVGDRVKVIKHNETGTIIRLPKKGLRDVDRDNYIVELDEEYAGWTANIKDQAVESDNAWFVSEENMELLIKKESKKSLEIGKWYDASTYTVEELKELLPVGTKVLVTDIHDNDRNVELEKEELKEDKVEKVTKRPITKDTRIGLSEDCWYRRYFKIIK